MLDGSDPATRKLLNELSGTAANRPLIFWIGAGASSWNGYPLWPQLADIVHEEFSRTVPQYKLHDARAALKQGDYPELFSLAKAANPGKYRQLLVEEMSPRPNTPVYDRFIRLLARFAPLRIVTTNGDECLERSLPALQLIQRNDIERLATLMPRREGFIAKLHGSVSDVSSLVFTKDEYRQALADPRHLGALRALLSSGTVVFMGTSLGDDYLLRLLAEIEASKPVFGDGPHYLLSPRGREIDIKSIRVIPYLTDGFADHRGAMSMLQYLDPGEIRVPSMPESRPAAPAVSAYYIADVVPPGTWTSSQTMRVKRFDNPGKDSAEEEVIVGPGFVDSEFHVRISTSLADFAVGFTCFDRVYVPLIAAARTHDLFGSERFWRLTLDGILRFVHYDGMISVRYKEAGAIANGSLALMNQMDAGSRKPITPEAELRRMLKPVPGRESKFEELLQRLLSTTLVYDNTRDLQLVQAVDAALLLPQVRTFLGISAAVGRDTVPKWSVFPLIRLATLVQAGQACRSNGIQAIKLAFGSEAVASAAFSPDHDRSMAEEAARFVLTGRFNASLGQFLNDDPSMLDAICKFRDTAAGVELRREILQQLNTSPGSELSTSINGGLKQVIPAEVLQRASDQFNGIMTAQGGSRGNLAVATNMSYPDQALSLWRRRSRELLKQFVRERGSSSYDLCLCGSGEKLRFCCERALVS